MNYKSIAVVLATLAAVALTACFGCDRNEAKKESRQVPVDESEMLGFDFSVLDVPEGKDEAFYGDAFDKVMVELNPAGGRPAPALEARLFEKLPPAMKTIYRGLENSTDEEFAQKRDRAFTLWVDSLSQRAEGLAETRAIYEEEKASAKSSERVEKALAAWLFGRVKQAQTREDYQGIADDLLARLDDCHTHTAESVAYGILDAAPLDVTKYLIEQLFSRYADSEEDKKRIESDVLLEAYRFLQETKLEGLYLDGTEVDWSEYEGKVTLVDFWATWCGPCVAEIPNVLALYEKYHDAGFEVVSYSVDNDLEALKKFEEERKLPWKTVSRKLSVESKENGGKEYRNLSEYYRVKTIPKLVLVGRDGEVLSLEARGDELKRLLKEQFPDVK